MISLLNLHFWYIDIRFTTWVTGNDDDTRLARAEPS